MASVTQTNEEIFEEKEEKKHPVFRNPDFQVRIFYLAKIIFL